MEKLYSWWEWLLIPRIKDFYDDKYFSAIRRTFYVLMPFWLTVSFFDILGNVFINPSGILMDKEGLNLGFILTGLSGEDYLNSDFVQVLQMYKKIIGGGYAIIAIVGAMTLAEKLSEIWKADKTLTVFCSASAFALIATLTTYGQRTTSDYFSELGFFSAFTVTILASKFFAWLYHIKKLRLSVPKSMPAEMSHYLSAIFPVLLTLITFSIIALVIDLIKFHSEDLILSLSTSNIFQSPVFVLFYQFVVWLMCWLGIPGYGVTTIIQEVAYMPAQVANQIGESSAIFTTGFFEAGVIHVLGLMIAILVFSQHEDWRKVSKFSLPLMFFNIQEVFIFGLPVVLNPIFLLPFIFAPLANAFVGWIAVSWGIVPIFQTEIPWTMPLFFGSVISTHSVMGGVLQVVWLIMDIFIYAPFIITANTLELGEEKKAVNKS